MELAEIVIIGCGPAGVSAALYVQRAGVHATVIGKDSGALSKAGEVDNYYGLPEPVSGETLVQNGIAQARRLGVEFLRDEVVGIGFEDKLVVKTVGGERKADCVILATGVSRAGAKIEGLEAFEGRGVSYCAVCDGFFYRGKDVAVLGCCEYALAEAMELVHLARSVSILTGGQKPIDAIPDNIPVYTQKIARLTGDESLSGVDFEDGTHIDISGLFVAMGVAGSVDFAKKLGAVTSGRKIVVDENMATNVPGLFAAGDCTGGMYQVAKAVYEGAKAGTEAVKYLREQGI